MKNSSVVEKPNTPVFGTVAPSSELISGKQLVENIQSNPDERQEKEYMTMDSQNSQKNISVNILEENEEIPETNFRKRILKK